MGSYCDLKFSEKSIYSSKSYVDPIMMSFFIEDDKNFSYQKYSDVYPDDCDGEDDTLCEVCLYETTVYVAKRRLDILGFGLEECEKSLKKHIKQEVEQYTEYLEKHNEGDILYELYSNHRNALEGSNITSFITAYNTIFDSVEYLFEAKEKFGRLNGLLGYISDDQDEYALGIPVGDLRYAFRILLECFNNEDKVALDVSDLISSGWYKFDENLVSLARQELTENYHFDSKIIILTEGSSDKAILEKSFEIIYPQYSPYYTFMDFELSNSQGGAIALVSIVKAFIGAGIQNRIIALFDNDTAARDAIRGLSNSYLPENIRVMSYPNYQFLESYPTIGPSGNHKLNVNGLAGSIELYLCFEAIKISGELSPVQWKGYNQSLSCYQGEVIEKTKIQKQFYKIIKKVNKDTKLIKEYDWAGLRLIFDSIFNAFQIKNT